MRAITRIASVFPGLFSWDEILNLDVRDFNDILRMAQIEEKRKWLDMMSSQRISMHAKSEQFDLARRQIQTQIDNLNKDYSVYSEEIKQKDFKKSWDELKELKKG